MDEQATHRDDEIAAAFRFFNEIGIIAQLSGNAFDKVMPDRMTLSQFTVLNHLVRLGGNRTPVQIARAMQVTKGAMTNTLGHLERSGWIAVRPDEKDGRAKRVDLTEEGRQAHRSAIAQLRPELDFALDVAGSGLIGQCLPLLETIRKALDQRRD